MRIKKSTVCAIEVGPGDFISDVTVMNDHGFSEEQCGCLVNAQGIPHFVCTDLVIVGGKVSGIKVKQGGKVHAFDGEIENIEIWQKGELFVKNASVKGIHESGGSVFPMDANCEPKLEFCFDGYVAILDGTSTLHQGTRIHDTSILKGSNCFIYGGTLEKSKVLDGSVVTLRDGFIKNCEVLGEVRVYKGVVENTLIKYGTLIIYGGDTFTFKNVKVSNGVTIYRKAYDGSKLPSLEGIDIKKGTKIINEIDDGPDNGILTETIIWDGKSDK